MEKDLDQIEQSQYSRGFNSGYILAKNKPELFKQISKALEGRNDFYSSGIHAGGKAYDHELGKNRVKLKENTPKGPSKDIIKGRGR